MKVRIEIEIGDKFIAEELIVPDSTFVLHRYPNMYMGGMKQEIWNRMGKAREKAITELLVRKGLDAVVADVLRGEFS